jgi:hypothetical protein
LLLLCDLETQCAEGIKPTINLDSIKWFHRATSHLCRWESVCDPSLGRRKQ